MAIATAGDLQAALERYMNRSDNNFELSIPTFVQNCEQRVLYGSDEAPFQTDPLRIRAMEASADLTVNAQTVPLPTGFLQQRRLYISATPNAPLDFMTPFDFWRNWVSSTSGIPAEYTTEGENLVFGPSPDTSYAGKILFYQSFTPLSMSDADSTNWLLTKYPGVYLWGSLYEAHRYTRNMDQAAPALNTFAGLINSLNSADKRDRYAGPWAAKSDTGNP